MVTLNEATAEFDEVVSQVKQSHKDKTILAALKKRVDQLNDQLKRIKNEKELEPKHQKSLMVGYIVWAIVDIRKL